MYIVKKGQKCYHFVKNLLKEMLMKRIFVLLIATVMLVSAFGVSANAKSFTDNETKYDLTTADGITFSYEGSTSVTAFPRGSSKLECLIDGDPALDVSAHNQDGIVLICNDFIKPEYEKNNAMADQPFELIPNFSFVIEYDETVEFDSIYLSLMHEINACVSTPAGNSVTVEYSKNGTLWNTCGTDGIFYYRACNLPDYIMDDGSHNTDVEERMVYLGKEYSAKYIRLTFSFMTVPEGSHWLYYTNVFEWTGFTEIAVGSYKSGEKPEVLKKEDANVTDVEIDGEWIGTSKGSVYVYKFKEGKVEFFEYLEEDYTEDAYSAEPVEQISGEFNVYGKDVTLYYREEGNEELLSIDLVIDVDEDGNLVVDNGRSEFVCEPYTAPEPPVESEPVESEPVESEPAESEPVESSEAVSEDVSEEASESIESDTESVETTTSEASVPVTDDTEEGIDTWVIIVIIAAVVVIGVVAAVIVIKKKK